MTLQRALVNREAGVHRIIYMSIFHVTINGRAGLHKNVIESLYTCKSMHVIRRQGHGALTLRRSRSGMVGWFYKNQLCAVELSHARYRSSVSPMSAPAGRGVPNIAVRRSVAGHTPHPRSHHGSLVQQHACHYLLTTRAPHLHISCRRAYPAD